MEIPGHVQNGVVVLDGGAILPEGAQVVVFQVARTDQELERKKTLAELPIVSSDQPGSVRLTNERIREILDEEDLGTMKRTWDVPS